MSKQPSTPLGEERVRPNLWFMYDCHVFKKIDTDKRSLAALQLRACFDEDGSGSAYVRWPDGSTGEPRARFEGVLYVENNGERKDIQLTSSHEKNWKVTDEEIEIFLDAFYAVPSSLPCRRTNDRRR